MSIMSKAGAYVSVFGFVALSACGTPEYRSEKTHCEAEWMMKIPPVYRQQPVTKYLTEERPTGSSTCSGTGGVVHCEQDMKTVSTPYISMERVDIKKSQRTPQIQSCAARACTAKYGNSSCKTDR